MALSEGGLIVDGFIGRAQELAVVAASAEQPSAPAQRRLGGRGGRVGEDGPGPPGGQGVAGWFFRRAGPGR